jgi:hypothetical protein
MKKGLILLSILLIFTTSAFADVTVESAGDVKVTFSYTPDYDAGFVGLVGDFQGWNLDGAVPMTKNEDGSWSVTLDAKPGDNFLYKFNVDGEWTEDPNAPKTSDDGFGGLNGRVVVDDFIGGVVDDGTFRPELYFKSNAAIYTVNTAITENPNDEAEKAFLYSGTDLRAKWYPVVEGSPLEFLDIVLEVKAFDGTLDLYKASAVTTFTGTEWVVGTDWEQGAKNFATLFFGPTGVFGAPNPTEMIKLKQTWKLPFVNLLTATGYAQVGDEESILYKIVKGDEDSNAGILEIYNPESFDLGFGTLDFKVAPNKRTGAFGLYSYVNLDVTDLALVSLGYNMLSSEGADVTLIGDTAQSALTLGVSQDTPFGTYKIQGLLNVIDGVDLADGYAIAAEYDETFGDFSIVFGAKQAGGSATLLYGDNGGLDVGKTTVYINPSISVGDMKFGADTSVSTDNEITSNVYDLSQKVYANLPDLGPGTLDLYARFYENFDLNTGGETTVEFQEVGLKYGIGELGPLTYLDIIVDHSADLGGAGTADDTYYELLLLKAGISETQDIIAGGQFKITEDTAKSPLGIALGYAQKLTEWEAFKQPIFSLKLDYNLNPWDEPFGSAEKVELDMNDDHAYQLQNREANDGSARFIASLRWDF